VPEDASQSLIIRCVRASSGSKRWSPIYTRPTSRIPRIAGLKRELDRCAAAWNSSNARLALAAI
jgi:hypothetical protein